MCRIIHVHSFYIILAKWALFLFFQIPVQSQHIGHCPVSVFPGVDCLPSRIGVPISVGAGHPLMTSTYHGSQGYSLHPVVHAVPGRVHPYSMQAPSLCLPPMEGGRQGPPHSLTPPAPQFVPVVSTGRQVNQIAGGFGFVSDLIS